MLQFIKEHVCGWFGVSTDPRTHDYVSGELKDALKSKQKSNHFVAVDQYFIYISEFLRAASKVNDTPIDKIFGGMKLSIVICRECFEVSYNQKH